MSSELENIIVVIDTREQNQKRIKAVEDWAQSHGAIVEHHKLDLCDYHIVGEFRDITVNIGIEAKSLSDFASSYSDLPDKLARAYQLYDDVALFVESRNYTFTPDSDNFHATIDNPAIRNSNADVLPLAVYENMLASLQREGVHVRQLRSEAAFPYAIAGLLINIIKPIHTGLKIASKDFTSQYLNVLAKIPHISMARATKLIQNYPNMFWLTSACEESLVDVLGIKTGKQVYQFLRCRELETDAWRNNYHRDGTEKDEYNRIMCPMCEGKGCANCVQRVHSSHAVGTNPSSTMKSPLPTADNSKSSSNIPAKPRFAVGVHPTETTEITHGTFKSSGQVQNTSKLKGKPKINLIPDTSSHLPEDIPSPTTIKIHSSGSDNSRVGKPEITHKAHNLETTGLNPVPASSHPSTSDDPQKPPYINQISEAKQEICHVSPAHTDKCINEIREEPNPKNGHTMNLKECLKEYLKEFHTLQECVDRHKGWNSSYVSDHVMGGVKSGYLKTITDAQGKTTFQRVYT